MSLLIHFKRTLPGAKSAWEGSFDYEQPNLLDKDFSTEQANQKWVGDITYIPTLEGWLYLAAIEDLYHK